MYNLSNWFYPRWDNSEGRVGFGTEYGVSWELQFELLDLARNVFASLKWLRVAIYGV